MIRLRLQVATVDMLLMDCACSGVASGKHETVHN